MMALSYLLNIRSAFKVAVFSWIIAIWPNAYGTPSSDAISRARCYANCITLSTDGSGGFHKENCETKTCQECIIPCKVPFTTERECQQKCSNSSSCEASCTFLHHLLIFSADGSVTSRPAAPTANNTDFSSISLHWPPVSNANGTVVYLIGMTSAGDQSRSSPIYFSEVYTTPKATLTFNHLCRYIRSSPFRSTYNGISYRFGLAALTENSSISYGPQSEPISLQRPDPVSNVSVESIQYSSASSGDKVKITFTWTPSENQKHIVTQFAVVWTDNCGQVTPRSQETSGPEARLSMPVYERLKKCSHTVEVYALINCTVSKPTKLIFEYPGCENVADFPKNICYIFDPPKAPIEDKIVRNVTYGTMIVDDDYTFGTTLKWDPPAYPYKKVQYYVVRWGKLAAQWSVRDVRVTTDPFAVLEDLLPGTTYLVKIRNMFEDFAPPSGETNFSFTTPAVATDEVRVRNLTTGQFVLSPTAGRFTLDIDWLKPPFNYSELSSYKVSYQIGVNKQTSVNINEAHFDISGISHGEPVVFQVTPVYKHSWINGSVVERRLKAPVPQDEDLKVRDLMCLSFEEKKETGSFVAYISWKNPAFNFSSNAYGLEYELSGYPDKKHIKINANETGIMIAGVRPKEILSFKVRPVFANDFISGLDSTCVKTAPDPNATLLIVQNLHFERALEYTPMKFVYNVSWDKPTFAQSSVTGYRVLYRRKGNPERDKEYTSMKNESSFIARELIPGDILDVSVTPIFAASIIIGEESTVTIKAPGPTDEENIVRNLTVGTFIEDKENNTYAVNFTWQSPSFQYSRVSHYNLFYEFSGYMQDHSPCRSLFRARAGCEHTGVKTNFIKLSNIFPRESVSLEVTPIYENTYIKGRMSKKTAIAPEPREELVKVLGLEHGELMATHNKTFRTQVTWQKPQFQHSAVKHYKYRTFVVPDDPSQRKRRETGVSVYETTENTNVTIDGLTLDLDISLEVTPVFVESVVSGRIATISLSRKPGQENEPLVGRGLSPSEITGVVVGLLLLFVIIIGLTIWWHRERQNQVKAKGRVSGKNALMIDQWEVDGDLVSLEEELGEGAFGKVFKGFLRELPQPSRKLSLMPPIASTRKSTIKTPEGFTVAVKMLHGMADNEQRTEFLDEIQLMKAVGSHKNIVNMIGCCTVEEPMFLLVEYIPYGDLLHYLRKRRGKVKEYLGDESRGPYRSTYWETYVIDGGNLGGTTVQTRRNDRAYANTPVTSKGDYGNIQLLSFNNSKPPSEIGTDNNGFTRNEAWEDDEEEATETLTPGDLMAFAWQISQGMEYLAKMGFVHRDLAARNVLVGDHKIAKVADFGLTRHVYEEKVYHAKRNRKLPLKWMSIEAIFDQTFTSQSDVWAFGVVLWELVTLGGTPYPTINNRELLRLLRGGYRMEKPDICNDEIYDLMTDCWREISDERPSFTVIKERLEEMMQKDNPYLDFSVLDESREYYNVPSFNSLQDESGEDDVFEEDSEELIKESSDGTITEERSLSEDPNGNSKPSFNSEGVNCLDKGRLRAGSVDLGTIDLTHSSYRRKEFDDLSNVKINVDELEMSLYRSRSRGLLL